MRTNCLLSGYKLVTREIKTPNPNGGDPVKKIVSQGIARTPFNGDLTPFQLRLQRTCANSPTAFKLKPRIFSDYEVAAPSSSGNGARTNAEKTNVGLSFFTESFRSTDSDSFHSTSLGFAWMIPRVLTSWKHKTH